MAFFLLLFSAAVILTTTLLGIRHAMRLAEQQAKAFRKKFPPITDEEFLSRCIAGTNPDIALKVRRVVAESLGVDYERIYPSSRLGEDLGAE